MRKILDAEQSSYVRRLWFYPLVLAICWLPATINRVQNFFWDTPIPVLNVLHVLFGGFQGFFDALVYGFTPSVKDAFSEKEFNCCVFTKKRETNSSLNMSITEFRTNRAFSGAAKVEPSSTLILNNGVELIESERKRTYTGNIY